MRNPDPVGRWVSTYGRYEDTALGPLWAAAMFAAAVLFALAEECLP